MRKSVLKNSLVAVLAAAAAIVPTASVMAQNAGQPIRYNYRIPYQNNPFLNWRRTITVSPSAIAQANANANRNARPVVMTPNSGPIGTQIRVQLNQNFGAAANIIRFRAVVTNGVPAQLLVRLSGSGNVYTTSAPIQMCIQGGGRWDADLLLTNGRRIDNIGSFTPTNCRR